MVFLENSRPFSSINTLMETWTFMHPSSSIIVKCVEVWCGHTLESSTPRKGSKACRYRLEWVLESAKYYSPSLVAKFATAFIDLRPFTLTFIRVAIYLVRYLNGIKSKCKTWRGRHQFHVQKLTIASLCPLEAYGYNLPSTRWCSVLSCTV